MASEVPSGLGPARWPTEQAPGKGGAMPRGEIGGERGNARANDPKAARSTCFPVDGVH